MLDERKSGEAINAYLAAIEQASSDSERQQAWQMLGIAYRIAKRFTESYYAFQRSARFTRSTVTKARIQRDKAMAMLDEATCRNGDKLRIQSAKRELRYSHATLLAAGEYIEAAATKGAMGRALLLEGQHEKARQMFTEADEVLAETGDSNYNPVYELNNLVWLARASFAARVPNAARARRLADALNQPIRWKEYLVILLGGDTLYRYMKTKRAA